MLKNIPAVLSPEILEALMAMGHGDELVIADANFPGESVGARTLRADGTSGTAMAEAVLSLMPVDHYGEGAAAVMQPSPDEPVPDIWDQYRNALTAAGEDNSLQQVERFAFYERAKEAYCVIMTGERALYANLILRKGVI